MDIALVSEHASPLAALGGVDAGGQNVFVASLATQLGRRGHRVRVYTRRDDAALPETVEAAPGVTVVHVSAGPPTTLPKDELEPYMGEFARWMSADWRRNGVPDLVHGHFWMSGMAATAAARAARIPAVQTFHALGSVKRRYQGSADTSPASRLATEALLVSDNQLVLATCRDEVDELMGLGADPDRIRIVPCGVDAEAFAPAAAGRPRRNPDEPAHVVALGRLVERKGVDVVVRALAQVPNARLTVAGGPDRRELGEDPEAVRLTALAEEYGVADRVELVGRVDRDDAARLLASADLVTCTPWYEPFGIVPLEAMACGRPVVGSAVGGLLDSIDDGTTGVLVPPRDVGATAGAIRRLADDPALADRMGRAGRERVQQCFTWERVAELTEAAYHEARAGYAEQRPSRPDATRRRLAEHRIELDRVLAEVEAEAGLLDRWGRRLYELLRDGGRVLAAGNGGSAAEAQHFTAELVGRFRNERRPLAAVCLSAETSSLTAIVNDYGADEVFARQVEAHGRPDDILLLLSTSGTSPNVLEAARRARRHGLHVWALTGPGPNPLAELADEAVCVPGGSTSVVQEAHLVLLHAVCAVMDEGFDHCRSDPAHAPDGDRKGKP
ncbi:glycosyltransferase [Pseudoclavibacter endophyticus]|uniref:Glycosyltransferase n=1 Tax=Pseudoclavibacter endophyticus TaxID=1778590 RepID=A0A6H9WWM5_9MICO|nr:glycosyltransferase [Pseudoclavibacter endophyticus]KAB1650590.1 glycosyltransferase [Pseudoclavibacter endophyticus]